MKTNLSLVLASAALACALTACGVSASASSDITSSSAASSEAAVSQAISSSIEETNAAALADGVYTAEFVTDSSMFHANEACDGKGTLTVKDGKMTFHVSLVSKSIQNLYVGTAAAAEGDSANWLQPTTDTVTYSDGLSEEVYGFDIPVAKLDADFDLAIIGKKGVWYDHKVSVCNAQPVAAEAVNVDLADGSYTCEVTLAGGSGKATVESPATLTVKDGTVTATLVWSSKNYDYMRIGDEKYLPVNTEGNSTFEIPVAGFDAPLDIVADTVAMSKPHEVEYTLTFDSSTIKAAK